MALNVCYVHVSTYSCISLTCIIYDVLQAIKSMNKQVRSFIQKLTKLDQDYYPEYLGKMFIVNTPTAFKAVWSMIKPWLDKRTQRKIEVHGSNFASKLLELVDPENLPKFLGGTCECNDGCESSDAGPWKAVPFAQCYDHHSTQTKTIEPSS